MYTNSKLFVAKNGLQCLRGATVQVSSFVYTRMSVCCGTARLWLLPVADAYRSSSLKNLVRLHSWGRRPRKVSGTSPLWVVTSPLTWGCRRLKYLVRLHSDVPDICNSRAVLCCAVLGRGVCFFWRNRTTTAANEVESIPLNKKIETKNTTGSSAGTHEGDTFNPIGNFLHQKKMY